MVQINFINIIYLTEYRFMDFYIYILLYCGTKLDLYADLYALVNQYTRIEYQNGKRNIKY